MDDQPHRELVADLEAIVWEADPETLRFSFVSEYEERLLGHPLSSFAAGSWRDHLHPEDLERAVARCAEAVASGGKLDLEYRRLSADGSSVWVRDIARLVSGTGKAPVLRGFMSDISEHKRADLELERTSRVLRAVIDAVPAAILGLDLSGNVQLVWNRGAEEMLGWKAAEVVGRPLPTVPTEEQVKFQRIRSEVAKGHTVRGLEVQRLRRDGSQLTCSVYASPLQDEDGKIIGNIAALVDVTDRHRAEDALRLSYDLLSRVFESTPDVIFIKDLSGRVLMINSAGARLLGKRPDEIVGHGGAPSLPFDAAEGAREHDVRVTNTGVAETFEERVDIDGVEHTFLTTRDVYRDARGEVAGVIGIARDISDRMRAEQQRLAHLSFLESLDKVNRAIQGARDLEQLTRDTLDAVLDVFGCDRVWLIYPCDPDAATWSVPMERTRPEYPGGFALGIELPVDEEAASVFRALREASAPVSFGPGQDRPLPPVAEQHFQVKAQLCMAVYPNIAAPYVFGIHQCSHARIFGAAERRLFQEIGRRLADALTSVSMVRVLRESEDKLEKAERMAEVGYWERDFVLGRLTLSDEAYRLIGVSPESRSNDLEECERQWQEAVHPGDRSAILEASRAALQHGPPYDVEYRLLRLDGELRVVHSRGDVTWDAEGKPIRMFGFMQDITERRRAEDKLRASEARFRTLLDNATDAFFLHDADGVVLDVNQQSCNALGYTREELLGMSFRDFDASDDVELLARALQELGAGRALAFDTLHRRKDGSTFPVEVRVRPFWEGGRRYAVSLARDMTERKRTEQALSLFRSLLDHTNDAIEVIDPETGRFIDVNEQACRVHGYHRDEYLTLTVPDIEPRVDEREWPRMVEQMKGLGSRVFEAMRRRRDGTLFPVEVNATYIELERAYLLAVVRDITERKRSERALLESHTLLNAVVEGTSDAIFVKDLEGRYLMINTSGARFLGKKVEEVIGKDDSALFSAEAAREVMERDREVMGRSGPTTYEETFSAAGTTRTYLTTKESYRDARGNVIGLIGIARDITDLKRLEEQFRQSQKMEAIGRLAGGVAHDFNNLLTVINGYSEIVLTELVGDHPSRALLVEIRKAGERAANLTRQLLAFSRRQVLHPQVVSVNQLLAETRRLLLPLIGENIELIFEPHRELGAVKVDPGQFEHAIINLAVNARDAMPGGGRLWIQTRAVTHRESGGGARAEEQKEYAVVTVGDSGHGMDPATLARVFEPFFTTKPPGKGTGLGLAMVYGFVKQSGGFVEVESAPGQGTAVKMYLPIIAEGAPVKTPPLVPEMPMGSETVLLVEDEDAVRQLSKLVLESSGYTVLEARDGREALELAERHSGALDLLVSDLVMPKIGGQELAARLRLSNPRLYVLFVSGYPDEEAASAESLGARAAFLQKPYSPAALSGRVRELLDAAREENS